MMNPLSTPIQASVLNLGACRDEQFAQDGADHGAFTGALLKVWNEGAFKGDYRAFRDAINAEIGSPSQTPQLFETLLKFPRFAEDVPFTINPTKKAQSVVVATGDLGTIEGEESDTISEAEVDAIFNRKSQGFVTRSRSDAMQWVDYADFDIFIKGLGLHHFGTDEFLILGGAHNGTGPCAGKNTYPPRHLWPRIAATAKALDVFRSRIGKPVAITNAFRSPAYNACIPGSATKSLHMEFNALDFKVSGMAAPDAAMALRVLRDREALFVGGIGRYNSFTHIDTRGSNATWPSGFRDASVPSNIA